MMLRTLFRGGLLTVAALLLVILSSWSSRAIAQDGEGEMPLSPEQMAMFERFASIQWIDGPAVGKIGTMAEIQIPEGYRFTEANGAQTLLEIYGNPRNPNILAAMVPTADDQDWTLIFQFDDVGYVKDDDKDSLDAEGLIKTFKSGIADGNAQRRSAGLEEMSDISWTERPFYDAQTNNLTWALRLHFPSGDSINYDIRLLGRHGVMEATLLGDPETYSQAVPVVKNLLTGYKFTSGNTYAEWRQGDKIAAYGLAGLVAGGAVALAAKSGMLGKLIKPIILGVLALGAGLMSFIKRMFGGGSQQAQ